MKGSKMSKSIDQDVKEEAKQKHKEAKAMKYKTFIEKTKPVIETTKTIALTALISAIIAFIGGVTYQKNITDEISDKVQETVASVSKSESK